MTMFDLPVLDLHPTADSTPDSLAPALHDNARSFTPNAPANAPASAPANTHARKVYVETYGCQMNVSDSEIVLSVMNANGYAITNTPDDADVIFLNTCAIRDNAERKIHERLMHLKFYKKKKRDELVIGVLGCMAERMREQLVEEKQIVDLVVGPDEYRSLPQLVDRAYTGEKGIAVKLSRVETYDDIPPLRTEGISAWVSVSRGCDKFCTFCVVPFTRGRERSRSFQHIVDEAKRLWDEGFKEVTLLGQNVNSYLDESVGADFSDLLAATARAVPQMRLRYTTSHPYDMSDKLIETMAAHDNICKYIHLPVQSGSDRVLQAMNRHYTVAHYIERMEKIKALMPHCALSTDIIVGFPTETEDEHQMTLDLLSRVRYDGAYMFKYSPRERTKAWKMTDDVPEDVKSRRLNDIITLQQRIASEINQTAIGTTERTLVEGPSRRDPAQWQGRTDGNKIVVFPHLVPDLLPDRVHADSAAVPGYIVGDTINVRIHRATSATLSGVVVP
jgi:tRNA-2-methylthio-N6-dimethylallyladenosine synthase